MNQSYEEQAKGINWAESTPNAVNWFPEEFLQQLPSEESQFRSEIADRLLTKYEHQMVQFTQTQEQELTKLRIEYVFDETHRVEVFLKEHRALLEILLDAVIPLRGCFGKDVVLQLQVGWDEGAPKTIYGVVIWKNDLASARTALKKFDETWWLDNSKRASGRIVFDYELV